MSLQIQQRLAANLAVTQILAESPALPDAVERVLRTIGESIGWKVGGFWTVDPISQTLRCLTVWTLFQSYSQFKESCFEHAFRQGQGLPGRVWADERPVWISDVTKDGHFTRASIADREGLRAAFAFPIVLCGRFHGVMEFFSDEISQPDDILLAMFTGIGAQIGQFIERKRSEQAIVDRANQQAALYQFTDRLYHATSMTELYDSALDSILRALDCGRASILLFDDNRVMRFVGWRGLSADYRRAVEGHSPWRPEEKDPKPVCIQDIDQADIPPELKAVVKNEGIRALAFIPLMVDGILLGKFMTYYNAPHLFVKAELDLALTIARQLAFAVDRKHKEEALRQNEERLRLAMQTGKVGVWDWDIVTNRISWTDSVYAIHGLQKDDFDGTFESFRSFLHPEDRDRVCEAITRSLTENVPYETEFRALKPDGTIAWLFTSATVVRRNDEIVRMLGATFDITQIKEAEHKVRDNERQLRELIEALPAAIYTTDPEGRITMYNQAAVEFSGRAPQIEKDRWCISKRLFRCDGTPLPHEESPMALALKSGKAVLGYEAIAERPDGSRINFIPYPTPLYDSHGRLTGGVNMLVDITARKRAEEELKRMNKELKELTVNLEGRVEDRTRQLAEQSEQLRQLAVDLTEAEESERKRLAQILHDHLQQLLVAAKMRIDLMERNPISLFSEEMRDLRTFIEQAYDSSRSLTAELRPPVLYEGGLAPALRFLARKFQTQYNLQVNLRLAPEGEPVSNFLKVMIYQSVQEMLLNAVKYAGVSECFVQLGRRADGRIHVVVHDEGVGFDAGNIGRKGSAGFGLFSIRERVKALGGECLIESTAGQGSRFTIAIPERHDQREYELKGIARYSFRPKVHKKEGALNILLADDHKIVRQSLAQLLLVQPFVHHVTEAEDGEQVVRKAQEIFPDVVIMDLNMPKINGIEATRLLHQINPRIKIIGLSVQTEPETAQAMRDSGAMAYFHKGEETDVLLEALAGLAKVGYNLPESTLFSG